VAKDGEKKKSKKPIIIIAALCLMIVVGGTGFVFASSGGSLSEIAAKIETKKEYVISMKDFVVNLSTADKSKNNYLKTQISLVYNNKKKTSMLTEKTSQIRDIIIRDLMACSSEQLLATGGMDKVKEKLKSDINTALGEDVVTEIYFTDFLIQ
jgi:flagellar basal body-associated protein FliL